MKNKKRFELKMSIMSIVNIVYKEDIKGIKLFNNMLELNTSQRDNDIKNIAKIARQYFKGYKYPPTVNEIEDVIFYLLS